VKYNFFASGTNEPKCRACRVDEAIHEVLIVDSLEQGDVLSRGEHAVLLLVLDVIVGCGNVRKSTSLSDCGVSLSVGTGLLAKRAVSSKVLLAAKVTLEDFLEHRRMGIGE